VTQGEAFNSWPWGRFRRKSVCRVLLVFGGIGVVSTVVLWACLRSSFDSALWRSQRGQEEGNRRWTQVHALERDFLRQGMSRSQVREVLGSPDQSERDTDAYYLGASEFSIDGATYVIEYEPAGHVISFSVRQG